MLFKLLFGYFAFGVGVVLIVASLPFMWGWVAEHRWQNYRQGALAAGQALEPLRQAPAIPAAQNFAAAPPFAAIPVDAKLQRTRSATLPISFDCELRGFHMGSSNV
jgi:hypothetical protein